MDTVSANEVGAYCFEGDGSNLTGISASSMSGDLAVDTIIVGTDILTVGAGSQTSFIGIGVEDPEATVHISKSNDDMGECFEWKVMILILIFSQMIQLG